MDLVKNEIATTRRIDELKGTIALDRHNAGYNFEEYLLTQMNLDKTIQIRSIEIELTSHEYSKNGLVSISITYFENTETNCKTMAIKLEDFFNQFNHIKMNILN
jgi:hypothetical protein